MTETSMAAVERLRKGEEPGEEGERDWLREVVRDMVTELM